MRVNELAKEVGKTPREVMDLLEKNHIKKSALTDQRGRKTGKKPDRAEKGGSCGRRSWP